MKKILLVVVSILAFAGFSCAGGGTGGG